MVYVLPIMSFVVGLTGGMHAALRGLWALIGGVVVVLAGLGYWLFRAGQAAQGWDGIGYAIWLFLFVAPTILGILLGALIGHVRRRRAGR